VGEHERSTCVAHALLPLRRSPSYYRNLAFTKMEARFEESAKSSLRIFQVRVPGDPVSTTFVEGFEYDAKGQRAVLRHDTARARDTTTDVLTRFFAGLRAEKRRSRV
jgi:hypothetical protein